MFGNRIFSLAVMLTIGLSVSDVSFSEEQRNHFFSTLDRKIYDISYLLSNGEDHFGETVIIEGTLWREDYTVLYLFPDIDTMLRLDAEKAILLDVSKEEADQMDNLSGCYVALVGDVGHPKLTTKQTIISRIESYRRSGFLGASESLEKRDNPNFSGYKCEMDVFMRLRE